MNLYGGTEKREQIYFRKTKGGNQTLVRADGTYKTIRARNQYIESYGGQAGEGWQRSMLLEEEYGIWDATAFGATMNTAIGITFKDCGRRYALIFISCEAAERHYYKRLPKNVAEQCRKNVDSFYADAELQKKWNGVILHPVCFKLVEGDRKPIPVKISEIGPDDSILDMNIGVSPVDSLTGFKTLNQTLFEFCE